MPAPRFRQPRRVRRFVQFRLRTLLILITVSALGLAGYRSRVQYYLRQHEAALALSAKGAVAEWRPLRPAWLAAVLGVVLDEEVLQDCFAVHAEHAGLNDADLAHLQQMPRLERLYLARNPISDEGLKRLQGLQRLERLSLWETKITDEGLRHVGKLRSLKVLDIHRVSSPFACGSPRSDSWALFYPRTSPGLTEACLSHLKDTASLRELHFSFPLSDEGLATLADFERLRVRTLVLCGATPAGLAFLPRFRDLETLVIIDSNVGSDGLRPLSHLPNLRRLQLRVVTAEGNGWELLGDIPNLEELSVITSFVDGRGLQSLHKLKRLRALSLKTTGITDSDVRHLGGLANLSRLDLTYESLTADALSGLENMEQLTSLRFHAPLDDQATRVLARMPKLEKLLAPKPGTAYAFYLTDTGLADLAKLRCLETAEVHDAVDGAKLPGVDVPAGRGTITDAGLTSLWLSLNLRMVHVSGRDISLEGLRWGPDLVRWRYVDVFFRKPQSVIVSKSLEIGAGTAEFEHSGRLQLQAEDGIGPRRVSLNVSGRDCQLDVLEHLPELKKLKLIECSPGCDWDKLRFVPGLEELEMPRDYCTKVRIDAVGIRRLAEMGGLRRLTCSLPDGFAAEDLAPLAKLQRLEELDLTFNEVTANHLAILGQLGKLQKIRIFGTPSRDYRSVGAEHLRDLPLLTELDLYGVTDEDMRSIGEMRTLVRLVLPDDRLSQEGLVYVGNLPELKYLAVAKNFPRNGAGEYQQDQRIERLRRSFPGLTVSEKYRTPGLRVLTAPATTPE